MSLRASTRRAGAAFSALALAIGCSVIVPAELDDVRCSDEGAIGPPACEPGEVCRAGRCVPGGATGPGLGEPCGPADTCGDGLFCAAVGPSGARLCTKGCCSSDECDASGVVCFPSAGGAALCSPAAAAGRAKPGVAAVGSTCKQPGECRSGWCEAGTCADACCHASDCAGGAPDCTFRAISGAGYSGFSCGQGPGGNAYQDVCVVGDSDCRSGVCASTRLPVCSQPCCSTSDCGTLLECTYAQKNGSMIRLCSETGHEGNLEIGEACSDDAVCRSGFCLSPPSGSSICTDACCRDVDCQDALRFACRLGPRGAATVLRCEPR